MHVHTARAHNSSLRIMQAFPDIPGFILQDTRIPVPLLPVAPWQELAIRSSVEPTRGRFYLLTGFTEWRLHTETNALVVRDDESNVFCVLEPGVHYWALPLSFHRLFVCEVDNPHWDAIEIWRVCFEQCLVTKIADMCSTVVGALPGSWMFLGMVVSEWTKPPPTLPFEAPEPVKEVDADHLYVKFSMQMVSELDFLKNHADLQDLWDTEGLSDFMPGVASVACNAAEPFFWRRIKAEDEDAVMEVLNSLYLGPVKLTFTPARRRRIPWSPEELRALYLDWKTEKEAALAGGKLQWVHSSS